MNMTIMLKTWGNAEIIFYIKYFDPLYSMDFPIHIDAISMGLPIMYFKGSQVEFSKSTCILINQLYPI